MQETTIAAIATAPGAGGIAVVRLSGAESYPIAARVFRPANAAKKVEEATKDIDKDIKIAVMGCVVNGIGESGNADIGIAGGDGCAVIFSHGEKLRKVSEEEALPALLAEIEKL